MPRRSSRARARIAPGPAAAVLLLVGSACGPADPAATGTGRPPLVVVFVVDTLRRESVGCYGREGDPTPAMDALAREGTRFDQAISASGWTLPAVASLLTGTWPSIHKAMGKTVRLTPISDDVPTAAEVLRARGFATCAVANAAFLAPVLGLDRGFDRFDHRHAFNDELRDARESVDAALAFLSEHREDPVFLLIHVFDPHLDYDPDEALLERFAGDRRRPKPPLSSADCKQLAAKSGDGVPAVKAIEYVEAVYQGEVTFVDGAIGRFTDALKAMRLYEHATIIVTADHGEEFWEHRGFEHGHTLYDELVRVPLIVKLPCSEARDRAVVGSVVRVLDVMPTVFALYGVEAPESFVGASLLPLIHGETEESRLAFSETTLYGPDKQAIRDHRYKYIVDHDPEASLPEELFDWRTDPGEHRNLIDSHPEVAARMRAELAAFRAELDAAAAKTKVGTERVISPRTRHLYEQSIDSLGYSGREDDD